VLAKIFFSLNRRTIMRPARIIISLLGFCLLLWGCAKKETEKQAFVLKKDSTRVQLREFCPQVQGYGRVEPAHSENLIARYSGNIHLQSQTFYHRGQIIYRLTGPDIALEQKRLNGLLIDAQANYDYMSAVYQRKKTLIEKKVLAPKDRDAILFNYRTAQEDLKQAQAQLDYFLAMTRFQAPYDGFLSDLSVNQNDYVQKGQILARFIDRSRLKLIGTLYSDSLSFIAQGRSLRVVLNGKIETAAHIVFLEMNISAQSGGHTFWANLDSVASAIKPGDYVHYVLKGTAYQAPAIPESALVLEKEHYYVVLCDSGAYRNVPVVAGQNADGYVEIKKGLMAGDIVLTRGAFETFHRNLQKTLIIED